MSDTEVVEGQALERHVGGALSLVPTTTAGELVRRLDTIREAMLTAMVEEVDFGKVPGVNKPTLLKPGAEKLGVLFQLDVQFDNQQTWSDDGHLTVVSHATVYHAPTGARVAAGEGICTSRESKYAFRLADRFCPSCGVAAIIKGKAEYGGGWVCFKKKGGCGAKFPDSAPEIVDQPGKVPNENLADTWNTVDKMATKRARIDAILAATGASALFTQDAEDLPRSSPDPPSRTPTPSVDTSELLDSLRSGIDRLAPTNPNWTEEAVLASAAASFKRPIVFLEELTADELGQILAAMPAES